MALKLKNVPRNTDTANCVKYPNPCCRCGFCCLSETCPVGIWAYGIAKHEKCPGLSFDGNGIADCALVPQKLVPIGDGCCIKARAFKDGKQYDFASLSPAMKKMAVRQLRRKLWESQPEF